MTPELPKEFPNNKYVDDMGMSWNMEVMAKELNFENMPNDIHLSMRTPVKTLGDSRKLCRRIMIRRSKFSNA